MRKNFLKTLLTSNWIYAKIEYILKQKAKRRENIMAKRRGHTTKMEIIQVALRTFMKKGYSNTSAKVICEELDISTGNLTYHFPTKEHILTVLVEMLCDFQWKMMERETDEGRSSLLAL